MSNTIVGGWSALESEIHRAIEFASNCAGPDGAKESVKRGVSAVLNKFKTLAVEEAQRAEVVAPAPEVPVADPEVPVADPEAPVADPEAPVADPEAPVADGAHATSDTNPSDEQ